MEKYLILTAIAITLSTTHGNAYTLTQTYNASNFFNTFTFNSDRDPTHGFVQYVNESTAQSSGLAQTINHQVYLGVDNTTVINSTHGPGRMSVRLESMNTFDNGILIADFAHLPTGECGTWPAYWTVNNDDDPYGEIDIVEGVNDQTDDEITLHTSDNACALTGGTFTGTSALTNCGLNATDGGCGVDGDNSSYGAGFNAGGGGLWVLYLEESLKIWLFLRKSIPADITNETPDPSQWGEPLLDFESQSDCNVTSNFIKQTIILNIDFCGDNAGGDGWTDWTDCANTTGVATCEEYVAANPQLYSDSYFLINSIKLYQSNSTSTSGVRSIFGLTKGMGLMFAEWAVITLIIHNLI